MVVYLEFEVGVADQSRTQIDPDRHLRTDECCSCKYAHYIGLCTFAYKDDQR
jgi:hypothetical protein